MYTSLGVSKFNISLKCHATLVLVPSVHIISQYSGDILTGKNLGLCGLQKGHGCRTPGGPPAPHRVWPNRTRNRVSEVTEGMKRMNR